MVKNDEKSINAALDELLKDPQGYKTFVFDSFTVFYEGLIIALETKMRLKIGDPSYAIQPLDYKYIKSSVKRVLHKILALDMNVVLVARAKTNYVKGEFMKEDGIKPDCPDYIPYDFDVNLELHRVDGKGTAVVLKDRTNTLPPAFDYTYEKFVEYMGIDGLEREPILLNQQKNLEEQKPRNVKIQYSGTELLTAGVTGEQLTKLNELITQEYEEKSKFILKDKFYVESFLDLKEDEAEAFIGLIGDEKSSDKIKDGE